MKKELTRQIIEYLNIVKDCKNVVYDYKFIAIFYLFKYYSSASQQRYKKYLSFDNYDFELINANPDNVKCYDYLQKIQLLDNEISKCVNYISSYVDSDYHSLFINREYYELICKLLELKPNDIV